MHPAERLARTIRHAPGLRHAEGLWSRVRPVYNAVVRRTGAGGLERVLNGTDRIVVAPEYRGLDEQYEPEVWAHLMGALRPGDTFVDVGAHVGLYTVAVARRLGTRGRVVAFEPDLVNARLLRSHIALNSVGVEVIEAAVGASAGRVTLDARDSESQTSYDSQGSVQCTTLDATLSEGRVGVLKVDVEGFEEEVLRGASTLLRDPARRPHHIYLEVHPFAWGRTDTTSESLLSVLSAAGYVAQRLDGSPVTQLDRWEEIVAVPG